MNLEVNYSDKHKFGILGGVFLCISKHSENRA